MISLKYTVLLCYFCNFFVVIWMVIWLDLIYFRWWATIYNRIFLFLFTFFCLLPQAGSTFPGLSPGVVGRPVGAWSVF